MDNALTPDLYRSRLAKFKDRMRQQGIVVALVSDPINTCYLTGFWTIISIPQTVVTIVPLEGEPTLVVPWLEMEAAREQSWLSDIRPSMGRPFEINGKEVAATSVFQRIEERLQEVGRAEGYLGVEYAAVSRLWLDDLAKVAAMQWVDISEFIPRLRMVKDEAEIQLLRQGAAILDKAVSAGIRAVSPGVTEAAAAAAVASVIWSEGAVASHIVVGSGPRSALPHPLPTERRCEAGELVIFDLGLRYQNYWIEIARTVVVGRPTDEQVYLYKLVRQAQEAAAASLRPHSPAAAADAAVWTLYEKNGYDGRYYTHSTGHGCGLLYADMPWIGVGSQDMVHANMVISLEPGLYFAGVGGIRLEDAFLVREGAVERLTKAPQFLGRE